MDTTGKNVAIPLEPGEERVSVYFQRNARFPISLNVSLRGKRCRFEQGQVYNVPNAVADELVHGKKWEGKLSMSDGVIIKAPMFRMGIPDRIRRRDPDALHNELTEVKGVLQNVLQRLAEQGVDISIPEETMAALGSVDEDEAVIDLDEGKLVPRPEGTKETIIQDGNASVDSDGCYLCPACDWRTGAGRPGYNGKKALEMHMRKKHAEQE